MYLRAGPGMETVNMCLIWYCLRDWVVKKQLCQMKPLLFQKSGEKLDRSSVNMGDVEITFLLCTINEFKPSFLIAFVRA